MKILYFARLRQIIGRGQDEVMLPPEVATVAALVDYLKARDERVAIGRGLGAIDRMETTTPRRLCSAVARLCAFGKERRVLGSEQT